MKKVFFILLAAHCFLAAPLFAQSDKMETDRPGETNSTELVSKRYFQVEAGLRKEQEKGDDYTFFHPRVQFRYGLSDRLELRAELTGATEKRFSENEFKYGLEPVELGFKAKLLEGRGALPATSLYTQVGIPNWASKDHQQEQLLPKIRMLFENKLAEHVKLACNAGAEWKGGGTPPQWVYTFSPQFELGRRWEAFVEEFAYLQTGQAARHHLDGGLAYFAGKNIKLDLWGGKGISHEALDYLFSAGVSFRLK